MRALLICVVIEIVSTYIGKENHIFGDANEQHEADSTNLTTHQTKKSGSYQKIPQNFLVLPPNYNVSVLEKENENKQIQNVANAKYVNNIGLSGKNNQDHSKIFIKNLHLNVGGNVSNIAHKNIAKNNKEKAITNVTSNKSSSKINNSVDNSKEINNKTTIILPKNNNLNKGNQGIKSSSSQNYKSKENTARNFKDNLNYNTTHVNQKTLDYLLPNNENNINTEKEILTKNYRDFRKKMPAKENIKIYNNNKASGYHNMHKVSQGTSDWVWEKKEGGDKESTKVKYISENDLHKIKNLKRTQDTFLIDSINPMEITKTHRVKVKKIKTITFGERSELDKKKIITHNNENPNLSPKDLYESYFPTDYDSLQPLKKVIESDQETSDEIKLKSNIGNSNLMYVILNNLSLSKDKKRKINNCNNKRRINKHVNFLKTVEDQPYRHRPDTSMTYEKDNSPYKDPKRYKTKSNICSKCGENEKNLKIEKYDDLLKKGQYSVYNPILKNMQYKSQYRNQYSDEPSYQNIKYGHTKDVTGYGDLKIHLTKRKADIEQEDKTKETSNVMTNNDKVISNILAPENVKSDKKPLPYWLPSDAQEVYEILQQPSKDGAVNDSPDIEMPLKEEIDKIVQLKKELGNENLEEIITLKVNTVGIGKATNIIDKLNPSLYDVYLKNFITKILFRLRQKLSEYEFYQQKNEIKNLDIHEIRKVSSVLDIFQSVRDVFNEQDDETLYELLVSLLRFNKQSDEDFDEEVQVILDSVSRKSIYGVLRYYLVPEPTMDAVRDYLKQQVLYPQFVYYKVIEDVLLNIKLIIINDLAITVDKHDDIHKNKNTMEELVKVLIILFKVMKDLSIPETTQRYIIEESVLDIIRSLAKAYIENYEETVFVQFKKQLQDALYNNIDV